MKGVNKCTLNEKKILKKSKEKKRILNMQIMGKLMRTSRRLGADSIESISGSDIMRFFGFRLVLF